MAWLRGVLGVLLAALVTVIAYVPSLGNEFAYDDNKVVRAISDTGQTNKMVRELQSVADYFTTEYWTGTGVETLHTNPLYRPVTVLSFAATHALAPGDGSLASQALPHHFLNLILHVANTLLVFFVVRRFSGRESYAPIVAAFVFGLAAIHAEAVAAIVGRADLFAFGFGMGALWCFLSSREASRNRRTVLIGACASLLWLAFCSKESALAWWPFLGCAAVATGWQRGAFQWRDVLWPLGIGAVPAILWFVLRQNAFEGLSNAHAIAHVSNPLRDLEFVPRVFAALLIWGYSILKMIVPYPLVCDYGSSVFTFAEPGGNTSALDWLYVLPVAGVIGVGVFACAGRTKHPLLFLGATAILGFGFLTSNIPVVIGTVWAERLAYLPSLGFALCVAWLFDQRANGRVAIALLAVYVVGSSVIVFTRIDEWKNDYTLFTRDVQTHPRSLSLRLQAAIQERSRGNLEGWRAMLEAANKIEPEWARAYVELGAGVFESASQGAPADPQARTAHIAKRLDECEQLLRHALDARIIEPSEKPMMWRNYAVLMLRRKRKDEALVWLKKIVEHDPTNVLHRHQILTDAHVTFPDAQFLRFLTGGEKAVPGHPAWEMHRGLRAAQRQEFADARRRLEVALPRVSFLDFTVQNAWLILAQLRAKAGDDRGARELFQRIASNPRFVASIRREAARPAR